MRARPLRETIRKEGHVSQIPTPIDLRSDTVTRPDAEMRKAIARAEVGDDVFGEDPTMNRLLEQVSARLGKEAAIFVPSGTMGNQICVNVHTRPGDEALAQIQGHLLTQPSGHLFQQTVHGGILAEHIITHFRPSDSFPHLRVRAGDRIAPQVYGRRYLGHMALLPYGLTQWARPPQSPEATLRTPYHSE